MRWSLALLVTLSACKKGEADLIFEPANNYTYVGDLTMSEVEVQAGIDACVDWTGVTTDIRGRSFDGSVDQVIFVEFLLSQDEIIAKVEKNQLFQSDSDTQWLYDPVPEDRSACLSDFEIIGNFFDPAALVETDENRNWLLSIASLPEGRLDVLMSSFVTPMDASTNTEVALDDASSTLVVDVDLSSQPAIVTQEDIGPYTLDWSAITEDVNGNPFDPLLGDEVIVAHFDVDGPAAIEDIFLDLDGQASEIYRLPVFGVTDTELEDASDTSGGTFGGFTADGTWLVGIGCTTCTSPAPLLISLVDVE